jgi:hypothetical protein
MVNVGNDREVADMSSFGHKLACFDQAWEESRAAGE